MADEALSVEKYTAFQSTIEPDRWYVATDRVALFATEIGASGEREARLIADLLNRHAALCVIETSAKAKEQGPDAPILRQLGEISDEARARIRRIMNGEAAEDRIRRGDVHEAIRSLRTDPVPSHDYQRALGDVGKLVTALSAPATNGGEA